MPVNDWPSETESGDWLVLGVTRARIPTRWRALDLDNKAGDPRVAAAIDALSGRLIRECAAAGHPSFWFPSRSGLEAGSGAGHLYCWLPELDAAEQEACLLRALSVALGCVPSALSFSERMQTGLDGNLQVFFPPRENVGAALSIAPLGALVRFKQQWEVFVDSGKKH